MMLALLLPLIALVFFFLGRYKERVEWNQLIEKKILPKPFKNKVMVSDLETMNEYQYYRQTFKSE